MLSNVEVRSVIPDDDFTEEDSAAELLFSASFGLFSLVSSVLVLVATGSMGSKACKVSPSKSLLGLFNWVCEWDLRMLEAEPSKSEIPLLDSLGYKKIENVN